MVRCKVGVGFAVMTLVFGTPILGQDATQDGGAELPSVVVAADAAPQQRVIPFQGLLTTPNGTPVADGAYNLTFKLYAAADSVTPLGGWSETHNGVTIAAGRFSVLLGTVRSLDNPDNDQLTNDAISFAQPVYLGIKVGTDTEMRPRKQLVPAVHAYEASHAEIATSAKFGGGLPGQIIMWGGPNSLVPGGWLPCDGRPLLKSAFPDLFAAIGTHWGGDATHFRLPDLRGRFVRGVDGTAGRDQDRDSRQASGIDGSGGGGNEVGSKQDSKTRLPTNPFVTGTYQHNHSGNTGGDAPDHSHQMLGSPRVGHHPAQGSGIQTVDQGIGGDNWGDKQTAGANTRHTHSISSDSHSHTIVSGGDYETRPPNVYVNFIIFVGYDQ